MPTPESPDPSSAPTTNSPPPVAEQLLLTAPQAAQLCGVALRTWRGWDVGGKIPRAITIGRSVFWRPDELRAWVAAGCPDRETWQTLQE
jgi:prophage regulatory protein